MEETEQYETERYFRFMPPKNVKNWYYFVSEFSDPYDGLDQQSNYQRKLDKYRLPYKYETTPYYEGPLDIGDIIEDIIERKHVWVEMTEQDIKVSFLKRAIEYYMLDKIESDSFKNLDEFLNFHYERYPDEPTKWLEYISNIFSSVDNQFVIKHYYYEQESIGLDEFKKVGEDWICKKRQILGLLEERKKIEEEEKLKLDKIAHQIILLRGLGILNYLNGIRDTHWPDISKVDFAKLVALIVGVDYTDTIRKAIISNEPDAKIAKDKVKSELMKIGIVFPIDPIR